MLSHISSYINIKVLKTNQFHMETPIQNHTPHTITVPFTSSNTMLSLQSEKQPLFEKPLTPSDVGKLNRLVIPKQYAERYFPIRGSDDSPEKGLLLSFDDECGKSWRFRYSYWNSSQSYVLTKGWSRFVKEKRLDAGDVVMFERLHQRLLIGWRRRTVPSVHDSMGFSGTSSGSGRWTRVLANTAHLPYPSPTHGPPQLLYQPLPCLHAEMLGSNVEKGRKNYKTLRLFGVNLECESDEYCHPDNSDDHDSSISTDPSLRYNNHMDI